jgi:hypothetical protein
MTRFWEMILGWVCSALLLLIFSVSLTAISGEASLLDYLLKVSAVLEGIVIFASVWCFFND